MRCAQAHTCGWNTIPVPRRTWRAALQEPRSGAAMSPRAPVDAGAQPQRCAGATSVTDAMHELMRNSHRCCAIPLPAVLVKLPDLCCNTQGTGGCKRPGTPCSAVTGWLTHASERRRVSDAKHTPLRCNTCTPWTVHRQKPPTTCRWLPSRHPPGSVPQGHCTP